MIDDLDSPQLWKKDWNCPTGDLQDGMLFWYLSQAPLQDAQIESRVEKEAFFIVEILNGSKNASKRAPATASKSNKR